MTSWLKNGGFVPGWCCSQGSVLLPTSWVALGTFLMFPRLQLPQLKNLDDNINFLTEFTGIKSAQWRMQPIVHIQRILNIYMWTFAYRTSFESVNDKLSCPLTIPLPPRPSVSHSFCFDLSRLNDLSVKKIWKEAVVNDMYLSHL